MHMKSLENSAGSPVVFQLVFISALSLEIFKCTELQPQRDFLRRRRIFSSLRSEFIKPRGITINMNNSWKTRATVSHSSH